MKKQYSIEELFNQTVQATETRHALFARRVAYIKSHGVSKKALTESARLIHKLLTEYKETTKGDDMGAQKVQTVKRSWTKSFSTAVKDGKGKYQVSFPKKVYEVTTIQTTDATPDAPPSTEEKAQRDAAAAQAEVLTVKERLQQAEKTIALLKRQLKQASNTIEKLTGERTVPAKDLQRFRTFPATYNKMLEVTA